MAVMAALALCLIFGTAKSVAYASAKCVSTPQSIVLENRNGAYFISWGAVVGNNGYAVEIDGMVFRVDKDITCYSAAGFEPGKVYKVRVMAYGSEGYADSPFSEITELIRTGRLSAPTNIRVSDSLLSWSAVDGAAGYTVTINGVTVAENIAVTTLNLSDKLFSTGNYIILIRAHGDNRCFTDSECSVEFIYAYNKTLSVPANVAVSEFGGRVLLSWDKVDHASKYQLLINNATAETDASSYDITTLVSQAADYNIKVRAVGAGHFLSSDYSAMLTYSKTVEIPAPLLRRSNNLISWEAAEGADRYSVVVKSINSIIFSDSEYAGTSLDIVAITANQPSGEYLVEVQANRSGNYLASDIVSISYVKYEKLSAPVLTAEGTVLRWTAVPDAVNYTVSVNGRLRETNLSALSYDFAADLAAAGDYVISVYANGNGYFTQSDTSAYTYVKTGRLGTPDVSANGSVVSWTPVLGAAKYSVSVNGLEKTETTSTSVDVSLYVPSGSSAVIGICARSDGRFEDGAAAEITVGTPANTVTMKTYRINIACSLDVNYLVYADGLKYNCSIVKEAGNTYKIELPSSTQKLIIVKSPQTLTVGDYLFSEIDLTAVQPDADGNYNLSVLPHIISTETEIEPSLSQSETPELKSLCDGGVLFYYLDVKGGNVPVLPQNAQ